VYWTAGEATVWWPMETAISDSGAKKKEQLEHDRADRAEELGRRAKGGCRRFARANKLRIMFTGTCRDECRDYGEFYRRWRIFERKLKRRYPWLVGLAVPEPQPGGHAWHWHLAVPHFLDIDVVQAFWCWGNVNVKGPPGLPGGAWNARKLAGYLAKYVAKGFEEELPAGFTARPKGRRRYWTTHGHKPEPTRYEFPSMAYALAFLKRWWGPYRKPFPFGMGDLFRPEGFWLEVPDQYIRPPPRLE
jgi:hypothetical protein